MKGFSLIELMIALAIISILTMISVPRYTQYMTHAHRVQAVSLLNELSVALEEYYIKQGTYEGADLNHLHININPANSYYQLALLADASNYTLTATPTNSQATRDNTCGTLSLTSDGEQHISGSASIEDCW